jgi:hypothetical protein
MPPFPLLPFLIAHNLPTTNPLLTNEGILESSWCVLQNMSCASHPKTGLKFGKWLAQTPLCWGYRWVWESHGGKSNPFHAHGMQVGTKIYATSVWVVAIRKSGMVWMDDGYAPHHIIFPSVHVV